VSAEEWIDTEGLDRLEMYAQASASVVLRSEDLLALLAMARRAWRREARCTVCEESYGWHSARGECRRKGYEGQRFTFPDTEPGERP
jgi:hypothetical protein